MSSLTALDDFNTLTAVRMALNTYDGHPEDAGRVLEEIHETLRHAMNNASPLASQGSAAAAAGAESTAGGSSLRTSKPMNLSQEWVTKVTSQDGDSPSVIGPPGIPDFERWVLQLNWYHSSDCTVKQPSAQCSCGLHALKSQIRQAHTDLEAEAERLTRCLAACDSGDCECPKQDETTGYWQCPCCQNYYTSERLVCPVSGDNRPALKSNEQPSAPASPPLSKSASSTDEAGAGLTVSKPAQHIPGALRCEKHGVTFAFDGDTCWACQEESNAPINS